MADNGETKVHHQGEFLHNYYMLVSLCDSDHNGVVRIFVDPFPVSWEVIYFTRKCTTLWGEPDRVHAQNMEQLHAFDCHQNVAEPQATENDLITLVKYTQVYTETVSQVWL